MDRKNKFISLSLPAVYLLFGLASYYPILSMWGFSHFNFLPFGFSIFYWMFFALLLLVLYSPLQEKTIDNIINNISDILWDRSRWVWLILSLLSLFIFYLFRLDTYFLGDGYSWLSIMGNSEQFVHKWTEPASLYLIRWLQSLYGGYTEQTALYAFETVSIISGGIVIYNIFLITKLLFENPKSRLLSLVTLLFSGHLLLYFGYVEFYAMSWAATIVLLNCGIRYLKNKTNLFIVFLVYLIALSIHIQAIYLLPGILFLSIQKFENRAYRKIGYITMGIGAVLGTGFLVWLYNSRIEFEVLILPLLKGRPPADDYTVLSPQHIFDIFNLIILLFPGAFVLVLSWLALKGKKEKDVLSNFLLILSGGSIAFLLFYGAAITMGFDWDIMSLTLLSPILWILYRVNFSIDSLNSKILTGYFLICVVVVISFLNININTKSSEDRYYTLLNSRHRSSWMIFAGYFRDSGRVNRFRAIVNEAENKFPDYSDLKKAYRLLSSKKYSEAEIIARKISGNNPYNGDFLQIMGNLYSKNNKFDSAIAFYKKAMLLKPYNTGIQNELGQIYMKNKMYEDAREVLKNARWLSPEKTEIIESLALSNIHLKHYDTALAYADTLFIIKSNSPGGHLINMIIALRRNNQEKAALHYRMYLKAGESRSDYESIKQFYNYLIE